MIKLRHIKENKALRARLIENLAICLISVLFLSVGIFENSAFTGDSFMLSPYLFLFISTGLLFVIALFGIFACIFASAASKNNENSDFEPKQADTAVKTGKNNRILVFLAINIIFLIFLNFVGFYSLALVYLIALELLLGERKMLWLIVFDLIFVVLVYMIFEKLLFISFGSERDIIGRLFMYIEGML